MADDWSGFKKVEPASDDWSEFKLVTPAASVAVAAPVVKPKSDELLGFKTGIDQPFNNLARGLQSFAGKPTIAGQVADARQADLATKKAQGVVPGALGQFAGNVISTLPLTATTGPIVGGALSGAALTDAKDAKGALFDAGIGAVGGKVGDLALKGLGKIVAPKVRPVVAALQKEGVTMTPGQILGGGAQKFEEALTSIPFVGDTIKAAQMRGVESFNTAAANRALAPLGQKLPAGVKPGRDALIYTQQKLSSEYDRILPNLKVKPDTQFATQMQASLQSFPQDVRQKAFNEIQSIVGNRFKGSQISGQDIKIIDSELKRAMRGYSSSSTYGEREIGRAIGEVQKAFTETLARQNPKFAPQLKNVDRGYAALGTLERAASSVAAEDGIVTGAQLKNAVKAKDSSLNKRQFVQGKARLQDLAEAGKEVLTSKLGNSGTTDRAMAAMLLGGLGGGVTTAVNPAAGLGVLTAALAYSKPGQKVLEALLTKRPVGAKAVRAALEAAKPAAIAAPAAVGALSEQ